MESWELPVNQPRKMLAVARNFDEIFDMVKAATEQELGRHRAGLTLVLGDIPNDIGAYHELGSNTIVMNRNLLRIVEKLAVSKVRKNSYVFMILLHEYLHSLGFIDDHQVRDLSKRVADGFFGVKHPVAQMAAGPLDQFFPDLPKYVGFRDHGGFETIRHFDTSSTRYIA